MLRISKLDATDSATLRLDGSLSGVWVQELRSVCETTLADGVAVILDCGGVSFSDGAGVALIRELRGRSVGLTNCSPLLTFQLEQKSTF